MTSILSTIAARNKLLDGPMEIDLSSLSTQPARTRPSSYVYKPASDYSYKDALAATGETELRRQVGQSQSLTNYYDSESYYYNRSRLFVPIVDDQKNVEEITSQTSITDTLENNESIIEELLNLKKSSHDIDGTCSHEKIQVSEGYISKVKVIVVSPNAGDRFKRLRVILGSQKTGNSADTLDEAYKHT